MKILPIARGHYQLAAQTVGILIDGNDVLVVWDEPMPGRHRPSFECPVCKRRCRHLYLTALTCRRCSGLDYRCRHQHRSVPGINRIAWLRRRIGIDQRPFTPLPPRPLSHTRYHRILAEIRELEGRLVGHLRTDINDALERRAKLRGMLLE